MIALSWLLLAAGPRPGGQPLAEVAGEVITVDDFHAEMMRRGGHLPGQYATVEQRRELLEAMIDHRALVAAARSAGYDRDPEVVAIFERAMVERYRQDRLDPSSAATSATSVPSPASTPTTAPAATRAGSSAGWCATRAAGTNGSRRFSTPSSPSVGRGKSPR